ncbi:putative secreted protein (Por secretion system target), partial [Spirosoma oryzae]
FSITSVSLTGCEQVTASERRVTLLPNYAGLTGEVIRFRVANEIDATTSAGPYTLRLYTDNPVISLRAIQGSGAEVSYSYNWLAACTSNGRVRAQEQTEPLTVTVLGNPVIGETVDVEIRGVEGQAVRVLAVDGRGHTVSDSRIEQATGVEKTSVRLGRAPGIYLLQISTASQQQTVKLIRE